MKINIHQYLQYRAGLEVTNSGLQKSGCLPQRKESFLIIVCCNQLSPDSF